MTTPAESLARTRAACGASNTIATLTTLCRLVIRMRKSELWIDDGLAFFSMCSLIVQLAAVFTDPDQHTGVLRYYLMASMFYAAIWSARLSILFSMVRVTRTFRRTSPLIVVAVVFFVTWLVLNAQIFWECEAETSWKHLAVPQCHLGRAVAIFQIISDVIADSTLLFIPIRLFMIIKDKKLRFRMIFFFGTCIVTTVVSTVHAAFLFEAKATPIVIAAVIENSVSLIVCNIPVMATAFLKLRSGRKKESVSLQTYPSEAIPHFQKDSEGWTSDVGSTLFDLSISKALPSL